MNQQDHPQPAPDNLPSVEQQQRIVAEIKAAIAAGEAEGEVLARYFKLDEAAAIDSAHTVSMETIRQAADSSNT